MRGKSNAPNVRDPCTLRAQIYQQIYQPTNQPTNQFTKFTNVSQLQLFFTKNFRGFVCVNCVEVSKEFQEMFKKQEESMLNTYKREVSACGSIIMIQKDNESKLIDGIKKLKEKEKDNIQAKELVDLIDQKFKQMELKLNKTLACKKVKRAQNDSINKEQRKENFASAVKENHVSDFRKILREEKLNEIEEERQQDLRKTNVMIFGREENKDV